MTRLALATVIFTAFTGCTAPDSDPVPDETVALPDGPGEHAMFYYVAAEGHDILWVMMGPLNCVDTLAFYEELYALAPDGEAMEQKWADTVPAGHWRTNLYFYIAPGTGVEVDVQFRGYDLENIGESTSYDLLASGLMFEYSTPLEQSYFKGGMSPSTDAYEAWLTHLGQAKFTSYTKDTRVVGTFTTALARLDEATNRPDYSTQHDVEFRFDAEYCAGLEEHYEAMKLF